MSTTDTPIEKGQGLRYNDGKLRYDLVPEYAQKKYVEVLTLGSKKYRPRNWEAGMSWSTVIASMKRHIAAFERGEDFDPETGLPHTAHIMCNAAFLTEYMKTYPEGDDRPHPHMRMPRIGLDIDEVLADWVAAFCKRFDLPEPQFWIFDYATRAKLEELKSDKEFWMNIAPKCDPKTLPFEPVCYVTSRVVPSEWTQEWLQKCGFPCVPVHTVGHGESKVEVLKAAGVEWFVDDRFENYVELNKAGICCFLMDAPHNRRYNVGHKRITELSQLFK